MGNCLKSQLKEVVNNDQLPVLGKMKIHINNTLSENVKEVRFLKDDGTLGYFPVGSEMINGTFPNGKTVVEVGDGDVVFPAGAVSDVLVPKYATPYYPFNAGTPSYNSLESAVALNVDDYAYIETTHSISNVKILSLCPTPDGVRTTGHFENIAKYLSLDTTTMYLNNDMYLNIEDDVFVAFEKMDEIRIYSSPNITGNLRTYFSKYCQAHKTFAKSRTDRYTFSINDTGIIKDFSISGTVYFKFTASNEVLIEKREGNNYVTVERYDIDTDTYSAA